MAGRPSRQRPAVRASCERLRASCEEVRIALNTAPDPDLENSISVRSTTTLLEGNMTEPGFIAGHPETSKPDEADLEPDENPEPSEQEG